MWSYNVQYGTVTHDENFEGVGYSGNGDGLNNPAMEDKMDIGPIPRGLYMKLAHGCVVDLLEDLICEDHQDNAYWWWS